MDKQKQELIKLIELTDDKECISFLLGCIIEFIEHRKRMGVK